MSILKGVMSYQRCLVTNDAILSPSSISEKLNLFKFRPLHVRGEDNETVGWCSYLSEYDHEKPLEIADFLYDDRLLLSMRVDSISLPKELLKMQVKKSLLAYAQEHKKQPDRMVKKEIELAEARNLRGRILPKTKIVESIWCQKSQELRIFCRTTSLLDRYLDLFQETFLVKPIRRDFSLEAMKFGEKHNETMAIETLAHRPIFVPPVRVDVQ
jgi:hypothetical protein